MAPPGVHCRSGQLIRFTSGRMVTAVVERVVIKGDQKYHLVERLGSPNTKCGIGATFREKVMEDTEDNRRMLGNKLCKNCLATEPGGVCRVCGATRDNSGLPLLKHETLCATCLEMERHR